MEIDGEAVLGRFPFLGPLLGRCGVEGLFLRFELGVPSDPGQQLPVFAEDRMQQLSAQPPRTLVGSRPGSTEARGCQLQ